MADLKPEDIDAHADVATVDALKNPPPPSWLKTPEEPPPAEEEPLPPDDEGADEEEETKGPDLAAAVEHLTIAVAELARVSGSPRGVNGALEQTRVALGK